MLGERTAVAGVEPLGRVMNLCILKMTSFSTINTCLPVDLFRVNNLEWLPFLLALVSILIIHVVVVCW